MSDEIVITLASADVVVQLDDSDAVNVEFASIGIPGTAAGDMVGSMYDPQQINADVFAWVNFTGVPAEFAPSAHIHAYGSLTGIPTEFAPSAHTHAYSGLIGIPATFAPSAHTHAYSGLTGIPVTFAPSAHTHLWADLTDKPVFGTVATKNTGTSGDAVPLLNASNTWSGNQAIANTSPYILLEEIDQTLPAGRWRARAAVGGFSLLRNTAVAGDFSTSSTDFAISSGGVPSFSTALPITSGGTGAITAPIARTELGLGTAATQNTETFALSAHTHAYSSLTSIPATFAPSAHTHAYADLTAKPILGTASAKNTGTSGDVVPLLDGSNTWSSYQLHNDTVVMPNGGTGISLSKLIYGPALYKSTVASPTGAIVLTLPSSCNVVMAALKIFGYIHNSDTTTTASASRTIDFNLNFFNSSGTINSANIAHFSPNRPIVRLGFNASGNLCIIIGATITEWTSGFPSFSVPFANFSYTGATVGNSVAWTSSLVTSLTGYTGITTDLTLNDTMSAMVGVYAQPDVFVDHTDTVIKDTVSSTSHTFNPVNIGAPGSARHVFVAVGGVGTTSGDPTSITITPAGAAASSMLSLTGGTAVSGLRAVSWWRAAVPFGTEASIIVNSADISRMGMVVYAVSNRTGTAASDTSGLAAAETGSGVIDTLAGGAILSASFSTIGGGGTNNLRISTASEMFAAAETDHAYSTTRQAGTANNTWMGLIHRNTMVINSTINWVEAHVIATIAIR